MSMSDEASRHEGGPLEKSHLKDMVQRNALESLIFNKITKNIETEKKAFMRQNSRDELDMKQLLQRLHQQQQTTFQEDGELLSSECGDESDDSSVCETKEIDIPVNPYPVTIIPKYGTSQTKPAAKQESPRFKRDSQYQTIADEELLQSNCSSPSSSFYSVRSRDHKGEWLGDPEAIQSVRRPRKTVSDQIQRKVLLRSQSEQNVLSDVSTGVNFQSTNLASSQTNLLMSPRDRSNTFMFSKDTTYDGGENNHAISHKRGGSMKERSSTNEASEKHSVLNKRGGSLKERAKKNTEHATKPLARSYSMLTKVSLHEFQKKSDQEENSKQDGFRWRRTKHGSLKERRDKTNAMSLLAESVQPDKQPSHDINQGGDTEKSTEGSESTKQIQQEEKSCPVLRNHPATYVSTTSVGFSNSLDENILRTALGPRKKHNQYPNRLSPRASPRDSPNISPLVREHSVFKY